MYILFSVVFAGKLVSSVNMKLSYTLKCIFSLLLHVVFVGRLVCSVNVLYMELSYTGSLDRSTRASQHVTVQISYACKTTAGFIHCFPLINIFVFDVYI